MDATAECPACRELYPVVEPRGDYEVVECPNCGSYRISGTALQLLDGATAELREALRVLIARQWADEPMEAPLIRATEVQRLPA